jgi:hypothetical protein
MLALQIRQALQKLMQLAHNLAADRMHDCEMGQVNNKPARFVPQNCGTGMLVM